MLQGVEFTLEIKNLALSDSKGHDLEKKIVVRVTAAEQKQVGPSAVLCTLLLAHVWVLVQRLAQSRGQLDLSMWSFCVLPGPLWLLSSFKRL